MVRQNVFATRCCQLFPARTTAAQSKQLSRWDADVVVVEGQEQYTVQNSKNDKKLCSVEVRK